MRPVLPLALLTFVLSGGSLIAQDAGYTPASQFGARDQDVVPASVTAYSSAFATGSAAEPPAPLLPPSVQMVPPVPPPSYTPTPRGYPGMPNPLDRVYGNPFAQATEAGGQAARTFNENFDGDFAGVFYKQQVVFGTAPQVVGFTQQVVGFNPVTTVAIVPIGDGRTTVLRTITNNPIIVNQPIVQNLPTQRLVRIPLAARYSGILITDNDNPRPQDRVYAGYNFYDNIGRGQNPGLGNFDFQRQMAGFEKTFLGGDASFGMRLPYVQQYGPPGFAGTQNVGDLTLIAKYAIINDRATGNLWSAGLLLTTPTGSGDAILWDGSKAPHSVLFQPWTGFVRAFDRAYVQGITSMVIPTDDRDPTLWNNSIGVGYYLFRDNGNRWLNAIVPTAEVHLRTPLSRRDPNGSVFFQDQLNVTGGVHFRLNRAVLSSAVCVPVVGPRPWNVEAMAFLNWYF